MDDPRIDHYGVSLVHGSDACPILTENRTLITPSDVRLDRLGKAIEFFGLNPRITMVCCEDQDRLRIRRGSVESKVYELDQNQIHKAFLDARGSSIVSHSLFEIRLSNDRREFEYADVTAVSTWVVKLLLARLQQLGARATMNFFTSQ